MSLTQDNLKGTPDEFKLESLLTKLNSEEYKSTELAKNCRILIESVSEVTNFAHEYDFDVIHANGFWSYVRLIKRFLEIVNERLNKQTNFAETEILSATCVRCLDILNLIRDETKNRYFDYNRNEFVYEKGNHKSLFITSSMSMKLLYEQINNIHSNDVKYLINIYTHFGTYWFCNSVKQFYKLYVLAVAFFGTIFPLSLKCVWSKNYRASRFSTLIKNPTDNYPFQMWDVVNMKLVLFFESLLFGFGSPVKSSTVYIPSQNKYVINEDASLQINENKSASTSKNIRCRLLINKKPRYLLIHCHGGGFLAHSPDCHETYLRKWSENIPNLAILSVDYALKTNFPISLQQVLDVYFWAISNSPDVSEILGCEPEKIVLAGDSAGANLVTSVVLILNDLRNLDAKFRVDIKMPESIISIYGAFLLSPLISPSRVIAATDPLISPSILLFCGGIYTGLVYKSSQTGNNFM